MPTEEQQEIIYSEGDLVFVLAGAGTGKTTTLVQFANYRKSDTILYIVYNASIKEDAKGRFPERVSIHTIHSLAFSFVGARYRDKVGDNLKIEDIFHHVGYFKDKNQSEQSVVNTGMLLMKILNHFFNSEVSTIDDLDYDPFFKDLAKEYWGYMSDENNLDCLITHDGYLKVFQLSNPVLDYDYIMVDEAQDSNEVMLNIVFSQNSKKIFVGDPYQKIYGFRGALNVFGESKYTSLPHESYALTESFRFGNEIANVANIILSNAPGDPKHLRGCDRNSVVTSVDKEMQYTILFRTNTKLFDKAIELTRDGSTVYIVGGAESIFNQALDAYYLNKGQHDKIRGAYLKSLENFDQLRYLADTLKIAEYKFLVRLVDKYKNTLIDEIERVKKHIEGKRSADVVLSSGHKSKGLEFTSVVIENDFVEICKYKEKEKLSPQEEEEINILYVVVTRATHDLELNEDLRRLVENKC